MSDTIFSKLPPTRDTVPLNSGPLAENMYKKVLGILVIRNMRAT